jgi:hypothetical protein
MRYLAVVMMTVFAMAACATDSRDFTGTWAVKLGQRNLFVLNLRSNGSGIAGTFSRPAALASSNNTFSNMHGLRTDKIVRSRVEDGILRLTIQNASDAKDKDVYAVKLVEDHAELLYDDLPAGIVMEPLRLERAAAGTQVATDWEPNRLYVVGDSDVPNGAMKALFDEDQRVRATAKIDWTLVSKSDADRREQTRTLLAEGALHTGKDFEEAAFVFQHGSSAQDYLLAHTLAMVAVSKGDVEAIWIAAATLDRYLENAGQKQIFGTQYSSDPNHHWTQEPYDRELISDALRRQLGVPPQALQAERLKAHQSQE